VPTPAETEVKPPAVAAKEKAGPRSEHGEAPSLDHGGGLEPAGGEEGDEEALPAAPPAAAPAEEDLGFDFTLTDVPGAPPPASAGADDLGMDFTLADADGPAARADDDEDEEEGDFDFGGFGSMELAGGPVEVEPPAPSTSEAAPQAEPMDFSPGGAGPGGGLDLEQPMSAFTPEAAPAWMREDSDVQDEAGPDLAPGGDRADTYGPPPPAGPSWSDEQEDRRRPERPEPRSRPSPPRRKQGNPMGMVLGVAVVAVVAGGGYFAWTRFFGGGAGGAGDVPEVVALPAVIIPDIPADLLPVMRDLGEAALVDMIDDLRGMQTEFNLTAEPRSDWLAGVYLANASQFRDVQQYWTDLETYVDQVRETDTQVFHEKYVAQLELAEIVGDTAAILLERADSGFLATRDDRFEAYNLMDDLVNAALDLHGFLLLNEQSIDYAPAGGGVSRDPVLEAVPNSRELGDEMWDMVDRITGALDALGTLDRVTTGRLTAVLFDRIRRAGFR
jgi:hypothetical protein